MAVYQSHTDDEVAAALTLAEEGWSSYRIAGHLGIPRETVRDWLKSPDCARQHNEAITAGRRLVALRTMQRVHKMLDQDEAGELQLSPAQVMVNYGIAQDKQAADVRLAQQAEAPAQQRGPFVIFVGSLNHQALDLETRDVETSRDVTVLPPASGAATKELDSDA